MEAGLGSTGFWNSRPWRIAAWSAVAGIMLIPIAVQLVHGPFGWSAGDFVGVTVILSFSGAIFDLVARRSPNLAYLAAAGTALAAGFGLVVVNGAVGLVGSEDQAHNLFFLVVLTVAVVASVIARGRPISLAKAMLATAGTHIAVSSALLIRADGVSDGDPNMEIVGLGVFALLWLVSAWLFRSSAKQQQLAEK